MCAAGLMRADMGVQQEKESALETLSLLSHTLCAHVVIAERVFFFANMCVMYVCAVRTVTHSDNKSILAARQRFRVMNEIKSTEKAYVVGMQRCMQVSTYARTPKHTRTHPQAHALAFTYSQSVFMHTRVGVHMYTHTHSYLPLKHARTLIFISQAATLDMHKQPHVSKRTKLHNVIMKRARIWCSKCLLRACACDADVHGAAAKERGVHLARRGCRMRTPPLPLCTLFCSLIVCRQLQFPPSLPITLRYVHLLSQTPIFPMKTYLTCYS